MRCFYHGDVEAVAICKSCQRGICRDCYAEVGHSSACRNRCEPEVEKLDGLIARNQRAYQTNSATYRRGGFMLVAMGILFGGLGLYLARLGKDNTFPITFIVALAVVFALSGIAQFSAAKRWREK